ncbi:MAG: hypothetical protein Fur006_64310 [Coleofasciculaceae cyanobacterium]
MAEELNVDPKQAVGQEAQLAAENMVEGIEKKPEVDVDRDYEASKEYSVSDIDKNEGGTKAAAATSEEFRQMAKEVNPSANA